MRDQKEEVSKRTQQNQIFKEVPIIPLVVEGEWCRIVANILFSNRNHCVIAEWSFVGLTEGMTGANLEKIPLFLVSVKAGPERVYEEECAPEDYYIGRILQDCRRTDFRVLFLVLNRVVVSHLLSTAPSGGGTFVPG